MQLKKKCLYDWYAYFPSLWQYENVCIQFFAFVDSN